MTTTAFNPIAIGATVNDGTGDEPRAGFTKIKSDHSNLLASVSRRQTLPGTFGVTSSAGSSTVLNDSTQGWTVNQFAGQTLTILTGTLAGYSGTIASNTATSITVSSAFGSAIGSGVGYQVSPAVLTAGSDGYATTAGGTGPSTIVDANQSWTTNQWAGQGVTLLAGTYAGQTSPIVSNTANTLTLAVSFATAIAAGTPYAIGPLPIINNFSSTVSASIAASQNNYAPAGWGPGIDRLRITPTAASVSLSGLLATGVADGAQVLLRNTDTSNTYSLTLLHESGSSSAANQFQLPGAASFVLPPFASCMLVYDLASTAWTVLS
jgi:hypothetical protein